MPRKPKAKFYSISFCRYVPVSKLDEDTIINGLLLKVDDEKINNIKEQFPDVSVRIGSTFGEVNIYFPIKIRKELQKYVAGLNGILKYDDHRTVEYEIPGGYLYSGWRTGRETRFRPEDLPDTYVLCKSYKKNGYIKTDDVSDILYMPSLSMDGFFRNDFLFIAYNGKKMDPDINIWESKDYDEYIFDKDIVDVVLAIEKNNPELKDKVDFVKSEITGNYNLYVKEMKRMASQAEKLKIISSLEELKESIIFEAD